MSLPRYLQSTLQKSKVVSEKEENYLCLKIQQQNCQQSMQKLIESNFKLVAKIAGKFQGCGLEIEDLIQEGNLGLIKAAERFDLSKGFRFSTYATWWIRQSILQSLDEKGRIVKIPGWLLRVRSKVQKAKQKLEKSGEKATRERLALEVGVSEEKIAMVEQIDQENPSLDFQEEDGGALFLEKFQDFNQKALDFSLIEKEMEDCLKEAMKTLSPREREVLQARFEGDQQQTLQHIGERLGMSNERVRQIEKKALEKLRKRIV